MLRNLLHFGDRTAGEVAVTRGDIIAVPDDDQLRRAGRRLRRRRAQPPAGLRRRLDEVVGMIHIKDVFKADSTTRRATASIAGLLRTPLFVPESMGVLELLARMRARARSTSRSSSTSSAAPRGW